MRALVALTLILGAVNAAVLLTRPTVDSGTLEHLLRACYDERNAVLARLEPGAMKMSASHEALERQAYLALHTNCTVLQTAVNRTEGLTDARQRRPAAPTGGRASD